MKKGKWCVAFIIVPLFTREFQNDINTGNYLCKQFGPYLMRPIIVADNMMHRMRKEMQRKEREIPELAAAFPHEYPFIHSLNEYLLMLGHK